MAETLTDMHWLASCIDCADEAASGAFWAPPAEIFESEMQDLPMEPRLGLFASVRRANSSEVPTAGEATVTDGEHRKVTGGGKERAIRVCEPCFRGLLQGRNVGL